MRQGWNNLPRESSESRWRCPLPALAHAGGQREGLAALGEAQAARARKMYAAGSSVEEIAARFAVSRATIYRCLTT
ncbi:helix-turn-helix domain-containing protein [Streptosporangium roseum]|uniref:helix-turn-helix domain-containing protein n=1 Tax=Streptosporangium roseum TaxID=2001 RepID=UPI00332D65C9